MTFSAQYHVFPATFHVISRKVDYLWDSVGVCLITRVKVLIYGPFFVSLTIGVNVEALLYVREVFKRENKFFCRTYNFSGSDPQNYK